MQEKYGDRIIRFVKEHPVQVIALIVVFIVSNIISASVF